MRRTVVVIYLFEVLTLLAVLTTTNADVNCHKPPPHIHLESCCPIVSNFLTEEIKTKCMSEVNSNMPPPDEEEPPTQPGHHGGPHHHGPPHPCFISCVLNETGILIGDELQNDNLNAYLNQIYDDSEIVDFMGEQFRNCNEKRESVAMKYPKNKHGPGPSFCPRSHGPMLVGCTYKNAFKHCPDKVWSNTDECNAVRDHFTECGPPHYQKDDEIELEGAEEEI